MSIPPLPDNSDGAEKKAQIQAHARALAALLYEETDPEQVKTLAGIEATVRGHLLEHVSPEIGEFLLQQAAAPRVDEGAASTVSSDDCEGQTSANSAGESLHTLESLPGAGLSVGQCQRSFTSQQQKRPKH